MISKLFVFILFFSQIAYTVELQDIDVLGNVKVRDRNAIQLEEGASNGDNYVGLRAPSSLSANVIFNLPATDGTNKDCIKTDGSGNLSFGACAVDPPGVPYKLVSAYNDTNTAIPLGSLVIDAFDTDVTRNEKVYVGVYRDKGSLSNLEPPYGYVTKAIPADTATPEDTRYVDNAVLTRGRYSFYSTELQAELPITADADIYIKKTGSGSAEKWVFTKTETDDGLRVGKFKGLTGQSNYFFMHVDFLAARASGSTDEVEEGQDNLYFTKARVNSMISAGRGIVTSFTNGVLALSATLNGLFQGLTALPDSGTIADSDVFAIGTSTNNATTRSVKWEQVEALVHPIHLQEFNHPGYSYRSALRQPGNYLNSGEVTIFGNTRVMYINPRAGEFLTLQNTLQKGFRVKVFSTATPSNFIEGVVSSRQTIGSTMLVFFYADSYRFNGTFSTDESLTFYSEGRHNNWEDVKQSVDTTQPFEIPSSKAVGTYVNSRLNNLTFLENSDTGGLFNVLRDPGFEHTSETAWTSTNGTFSRSTTDPGSGQRSGEFDATAINGELKQESTSWPKIFSDVGGGLCVLSARVYATTANAALYKLEVLDNAATPAVKATADVSVNTNGWQLIKDTFDCPTSTSLKTVRLRATSANAAKIRIDNVFLGFQPFPETGALEKLIYERMKNIAVGGSNVTIGSNDNTNRLTWAATGSGGGGGTLTSTDQLSEGTTNLYYTNARVATKIAGTVTVTPPLTSSYNSNTQLLTIGAELEAVDSSEQGSSVNGLMNLNPGFEEGTSIWSATGAGARAEITTAFEAEGRRSLRVDLTSQNDYASTTSLTLALPEFLKNSPNSTCVLSFQSLYDGPSNYLLFSAYDGDSDELGSIYIQDSDTNWRKNVMTWPCGSGDSALSDFEITMEQNANPAAVYLDQFYYGQIEDEGPTSFSKKVYDKVKSILSASGLIKATTNDTLQTIALGNKDNLSTNDISEGSSNQYYTQARADARVKALVRDLITVGSNTKLGKSVNTGTGVVTFTNTIADTGDLPEDSSALYFTPSRVISTLTAGSNITLTPSGSGASRTLAISASGGSGGGLTTEQVDDRVNSLLVAGDNLSKTYNDSANSLTLDVTGIPSTTDNLNEGSTNQYYTGERVDDRVASLLTEGVGIDLDYTDNGASDGTLRISAMLPETLKYYDFPAFYNGLKNGGFENVTTANSITTIDNWSTIPAAGENRATLTQEKLTNIIAVGSNSLKITFPASGNRNLLGARQFIRTDAPFIKNATDQKCLMTGLFRNPSGNDGDIKFQVWSSGNNKIKEISVKGSDWHRLTDTFDCPTGGNTPINEVRITSTVNAPATVWADQVYVGPSIDTGTSRTANEIRDLVGGTVTTTASNGVNLNWNASTRKVSVTGPTDQYLKEKALAGITWGTGLTKGPVTNGNFTVNATSTGGTSSYKPGREGFNANILGNPGFEDPFTLNSYANRYTNNETNTLPGWTYGGTNDSSYINGVRTTTAANVAEGTGALSISWSGSESNYRWRGLTYFIPDVNFVRDVEGLTCLFSGSYKYDNADSDNTSADDDIVLDVWAPGTDKSRTATSDDKKVTPSIFLKGGGEWQQFSATFPCPNGADDRMYKFVLLIYGGRTTAPPKILVVDQLWYGPINAWSSNYAKYVTVKDVYDSITAGTGISKSFSSGITGTGLAKTYGNPSITLTASGGSSRTDNQVRDLAGGTVSETVSNGTRLDWNSSTRKISVVGPSDSYIQSKAPSSFPNLIANGSFETNTNGWTASSGVSIGRTSSERAVGSYAASVDFSSSSQFIRYDIPSASLPNALKDSSLTGNWSCNLSGWFNYNRSAADRDLYMEAYARGSSDSSRITITNISIPHTGGTWRYLEFNFPCMARTSDTRLYGVNIVPRIANPSILYFDDIAMRITSRTGRKVYSARVASTGSSTTRCTGQNTTCAIYDQQPAHWLKSAVTDTETDVNLLNNGTYFLTYNDGFFSQTPICWGNVLTTYGYSVGAFPASGTQRFRVFTAGWNNVATASDQAFQIFCEAD